MGRAALQYDVFVSYSHASDDLLSERVQDGLQRFAKPWWRRRELTVFRDRTGLSADPGLWSSIVEAMEASKYFLLLASPEAAASLWVGREVAHWRELHGADHLLVLLTDGEIIWDDAANDFDWTRTVSVPPALAGCFADEPRHVDMRWARSEEQLDLTNGRFRDEIAELSAPVHGVRKDDIAGEHVRQHRRTMRTVWAAAITLAVLSAASVVGAVFAVKSAAQARRSEARAVAQQHRADSQAQLATARGAEVTRSNAQLARANTSLNDTNQQLSSKNVALISQTNLTEQQRQQAVQNATRATNNAAEAKRNADRATVSAQQAIANAEEAARNADEAARNAETARQNAEDAKRQRDRAILNEQTANTQRDLATRATARANHERDVATAAEVAAKTAEAAAIAADAADLSRQFAAQSLVEIDNLDRALLLGVASREISPTPAAHGSLMRLAESSVGVEGFLRPVGVTPDSPNVGAVAVAISPDGLRRAEWISSANVESRKIFVWEGVHARSATMLTSFDPGPTFSVSGMSFSSDGGHLAAWDSIRGLIRSWDLSDPSVSHEHPLACDLHVPCSPVVTPDGQLVIPGHDLVSFLDPVTLQGPTRSGRLGADGQGPTGTCAIPASSGVRPLTPFGSTEPCLSPGGRYAIGRTPAGEAVLWDRSDNAAAIVLHSGLLPLEHPVVSVDDAVAVATTAAGEVHVFDTASRLETTSFAAPLSPRALAISPDRTSLAMIDAAGNVAVRPLAFSGQVLDTTVHPSNPPRLEYTPDGRWLAITDVARVQVILAAGPDAGRIGADLAATGFAFDRSGVGHVLAALPDTRTLLVWDLTTNAAATAATAPHGFGQQVIVSPDGQTVAALSADEKVMLFSLRNLIQLPRTLPASRFMQTLAFGPGSRFVGVEGNGTLAEWDLSITQIGQLVATGDPPCTDCLGQLLAVSADGTTIAFADETMTGSGTVSVRHAGGITTTLPFFSDGAPDRLAFTPGGHYVVLHQGSGTFVLPVDGAAPQGTTDELVAFTADDKTAASVDKATNTVRLWSLPTLALRNTIALGSMPAQISRVALDKAGDHLAAIDAGGNVALFDVATKLEIRHWSIPSTGPDSTLIMSDDGNKLAVWAQNHTVWVLDAARATPVGDVTAGLPAIAFSPDGSLLATAGPGVQVWATTSPLESIGDPLPGDLPADPSVAPTSGVTNVFTPNVLQFARDGKDLLELQPGPAPQTFSVRSVVVDAQSLADSACSIAARDLTLQERQRFDPGNRLPVPICG
jgi:WD40 repeat protein